MKHAHLIGSIYEAALDPGRLGHLLAAVSSHAEATVGHIDIEDASSGEVMLAAAPGLCPGWQGNFFRRYRALDPRRTLLDGAPAGKWWFTQDHFDRVRLERDPFHREFAIPGGGGHGAVTRLDFGNARGFFCRGRALRRGPFPETVRRRLARLTPHLAQAGHLAAHANLGFAMQLAHRALLDHLADAVIVVAREGRYLHGNASARALLEAGDGLQVTAGTVHACDPHAATLLARTAGGGGARAGEPGRGFAVVGGEVRELARRSAVAAKEIATIITDSTREISSGVELVGEAGAALTKIDEYVSTIDANVDAIAHAAGEQAISLDQINTSVNHIDQMTQRNAAMVQETTKMGHSLAERSTMLAQLVGRFKLNRRRAVREPGSPAAARGPADRRIAA